MNTEMNESHEGRNEHPDLHPCSEVTLSPSVECAIPAPPPKPKLNFNWPVRTKGGTPVTIISTEMRGDCPIAGYIGDSKYLSYWYEDGNPKDYTYLGEGSLVQVPATATVFVAFFKDRTSKVLDSEQQARAMRNSPLLTSIIRMNVIDAPGTFDVEPFES